MTKKIIAYIILLLILFLWRPTICYSEDSIQIMSYYFINTCVSCKKLESTMDEFIKRNNITLLKKDISIKENLNEFLTAQEKYNIPGEKRGVVPVIIFKDDYYIGEDEIEFFLNEYKDGTVSHIPQLDTFSEKNNNKTTTLGVLGVCYAGLLDGINPCAISMLLMFISIAQLSNRKNLLFIGGGFIVGTFFAYFTLGTLIYNYISKVDTNAIRYFIKFTGLILMFILVCLNIYDYIVSKNQQYGKITLQLPLFLRKISHQIIQKIKLFSSNLYLMIIIAFAISVIISLTEFMCTGQIYLPTIITIIQLNESINIQAISLLLIYNLGFITR